MIFRPTLKYNSGAIFQSSLFRRNFLITDKIAKPFRKSRKPQIHVLCFR